MQEGKSRANSLWWPQERRMGLPSCLPPSAAAASPGMSLLPCCMLGQAQVLTAAHLQPVLAASGCHGKHCPQEPGLHALPRPWPECCADNPHAAMCPAHSPGCGVSSAVPAGRGDCGFGGAARPPAQRAPSPSQHAASHRAHAVGQRPCSGPPASGMPCSHGRSGPPPQALMC